MSSIAPRPRGRWRRRLIGAYLELRVIPVLLWSFAGIAVGTALAGDDSARSTPWFIATIGIGTLLQGFVAHSVNEIVDWRSGTDEDPAPRVLSGGSKVLRTGLLDERELACLGACAGAGSIALGLVTAAHRGWWLIGLGLVGAAGAVVYTLPPVRAAYSPFAGEIVAFACVWACVVGGYGVQAGALSVEAAVVGVAHAGLCVSMLMLHHYLDRGPDARAIPPKITSVVRLGSAAPRYGMAWAALALGAAGLAGAIMDPRILPMSAASLIAVIAHELVRPDDPVSVTRWESVVIGAGIAGSLTAASLLDPGLAWVVAVPAILVPVELAMARRWLGQVDPAGPAPQAPTG